MGAMIASGNLKGGTGKSTVAVNLASVLARRGWRTGLADLDPQGTAVGWAVRGQLPIDVFAVPLDGAGCDHAWSERLVTIERRFEVLVVDLPPLLRAPLAAITMLCDLLLVPVTPSAVDAAATAEALAVAQWARDCRPDGWPRGLLVPNRVDLDAHYDEATRAAIESLAGVWTPPLSRNTVFANAFAAGRWVGDHGPGSSAEREVEALADAVVRYLGLPLPENAAPPAPVTA